MISVNDVVKEYPLQHGRTKKALNHISFDLAKGERIALLGRNGCGKSTLIRVLGGVELPTSGNITRDMSISWPIAFNGGVQGQLSGIDNIRFLSRIYGLPFDELREYVEEFAELGAYIREPVKTYSAGMQARLSFGLSLALDFDCYLIDEVIAVGDQRFHQKCVERLFARKSQKSFIVATHIVGIARDFCSTALVMRNGRGKVFDDLEVAIDIYMDL